MNIIIFHFCVWYSLGAIAKFSLGSFFYTFVIVGTYTSMRNKMEKWMEKRKSKRKNLLFWMFKKRRQGKEKNGIFWNQKARLTSTLWMSCVYVIVSRRYRIFFWVRRPRSVIQNNKAGNWNYILKRWIWNWKISFLFRNKEVE